ncbi:chloride channel 3/4/5 [Geosmithia morbida]|uniref:Chloride channel protein n=1 Tax=Geosmithia morbida TaxID=1094350 RepID=A0A9P4YWY4_9HYPO|nr:chloride channel 3/4/5 [Geosmithia morbida]KAF4123236.1 chloride channel 3/4/5 [Geosmithia morbida]
MPVAPQNKTTAFAPASASASASSSPPSPIGANTPTHSDDRDDDDELDLLDGEAADPNRQRRHDVLDDDPLHSDLRTPMSFKRSHKRGSSFLSLGRNIWSSLRGGEGGPGSSARIVGSSSGGGGDNYDDDENDHIPDANHLSAIGNSNGSSKYDAPLDWYIEGPGRRVGYEDLTAIDWIFEYNKERQRIRSLAPDTGGGGGGVVGTFRHLVDASQIWIIILLTGLSVGALAAIIDISTDWLGDLKEGYCSSGPEGGKFYLNKRFCCFGYDQGSKCLGWRTWGETLGAHSVGLKWIIGYIFYTIFSVTLASTAAILVQEYAPYAKHSGIPEIKTVLGGFVMKRFLGLWTLVIKSFGLVLAVASGMWLGKEGPLVHVACCCANIFSKPFPSISGNEARKREVLSAAAASGISVAFGSPIGGVLFSLEQLSYYFPDKTMWQSFVCAMTAAVSLQALDPFRSGKLVLYQTKFSTDWHGFEIIPYALLGVLGGVYGGLFIRANMAVARFKKTTSWLPTPLVQVVVVALLSAVINYPNFYMKIQTTGLVSNLFTECSQLPDDQLGLCRTGFDSAGNIVLLLVAALIGFFLAAITFGLEIPAGIILPSMAIGALVGRAVGIVMEMLYDAYPDMFLFQSCSPDVACVTPGPYAIIGAAAALAGVTRMTVSIVVIMFELTGALTYVLPIMVAVMISKWVGDAFSRRGIYESWIHLNEYPFLDNADETTTTVPDVPALQIMTRIEDLVVLTATGHTMASLTDVLESHPHRGFPVVSDARDAVLLGYISRAELSYNVHAASRPPRSLPPDTEAFFSHQPLADPRSTLDLRPWMDHTPITMSSRTPLHLVVSYFQRLGLRYVLFSDKGVLQGLLTKKDMWYVLDHGAQETRRTADAPAGGNHPASSSAPAASVSLEDTEDDDGAAEDINLLSHRADDDGGQDALGIVRN